MKIKKLIQILKFIINHPINKDNKLEALNRFIKWQIYTKIFSYPIIYPFIENTKFIMWKGLVGATGNLYCGLDEFEDMGFLLHFLRKEDLFIDIGSNVGSYTLLASSCVGANSITIEPIPSTYEILMDNITINKINNKVTALNIGLGSVKGVLRFTKDLDSINHVATEEELDTINVNIITLDELLKNSLNKTCLIKLDVEGFESEVINGGKSALCNNNIKAVIIELNGSGLRYGFSEDKIHQDLLQFGFKPFLYSPFERKLTEISYFGKYNTIYIKDFNFVNQRLLSSKTYKIFNKNV